MANKAVSEDLKLYTVVHEHRFGVDCYLTKWSTTPTLRQVIRCCDIDYEPEMSESITIGQLDGDEPIILDWAAGDERDLDDNEGEGTDGDTA
jgi:hypothetical protein